MAVQLAKTDALGRKEIGAVWSSIEETLHNNRRPKIALPVDAIGRGAGASVGAVLIADEQLERLRNTVRELVTQRGGRERCIRCCCVVVFFLSLACRSVAVAGAKGLAARRGQHGASGHGVVGAAVALAG